MERASKYPYLGDVPLTRFTPPLLDDDDAFTTLRLDSSYTGFFMYLDMAADTRRDEHFGQNSWAASATTTRSLGAERTIVLRCWRADMTVTTIKSPHLLIIAAMRLMLCDMASETGDERGEREQRGENRRKMGDGMGWRRRMRKKKKKRAGFRNILFWLLCLFGRAQFLLSRFVTRACHVDGWAGRIKHVLPRRELGGV